MSDDSNLLSEIAGLRAIAEEDARLNALNGIDLNPYSTYGARTLWQQGWDGVRPPNLVDGCINWRRWQRGVQARILSSEHQHNITGTP